MKFKFKILVLVILLLVVGGGAFAGFMFMGFRPTNQIQLDYKPDRPKFADIDTITNLKVPTTDQEKNQLAYNLYKLANENDQKVAGRMYYSFCNTSNVAMGMPQVVDLYIFSIKDDDEYFRADYRVKNSVPILDAIPAFNSLLELIVTEVQYTNKSLDKLYFQKVLNAELDKEKKVPTADWSVQKSISNKYKEIPYFNSKQELKYEKFDHTVLVETIASSTIEKTADGVKVKMVLDVKNEKTTQNTIELIRTGSGDKNAVYTSIEVEFELWANGYYKTTSQKEKWKGVAAGIAPVSSTFDYNDVYVYNKEIYNLDTYYDAKYIKEKCKDGLPPLTGKK